MAAKQVMDMRSTTNGISRMESDEQQRNWTNNKWQDKAKDSLANYDPTRAHLNFEIARGGIVQSIDKSKSIAQKMAENLASRSIKDPNARPDARRKHRTIAQFIFGGKRERMHELAFGNQKVDLTKGADNSALTRSKNIEYWARDVYDFMARHYGEDNIISFYVHLDEKNPHVHCTLVPVDEETNRISWRKVFGETMAEESTNMTTLHSTLQKEVNEKWGLERGCNMAETKARHRSTEEYKRDLVRDVWQLANTKEELQREIHRQEIKLKGISTMITNLNDKKEQILNEIDLLAGQLGQEGADATELASRIAELRKEMATIDETLQKRCQQKEEVNKAISALTTKLQGMYSEHERMRRVMGDDADKMSVLLQRNILATYNTMMTSSLEPLVPTLSSQQQDILVHSGFAELTNGVQDVINCAMLLALQYVKEATAYAESCGGSSTSPGNWGRDKDEDDEHWWRRCIAQSAAMLRPSGRRVRRGR